MSGLYVASSTAEIWLEASTFRKTIAYLLNLLNCRQHVRLHMYQHKHFVQKIPDLEAGERYLSFAITLII